MSQPNAFMALQTDLQMMVSTGGSILGLLRSPSAMARLVPADGFRLGSDGEAWLLKTFGGVGQYRLKTGQGWRILDNLVNGTMAQEAKVGYVAYSSDVLEQIAKDEEILKKHLGGVQSYAWFFFKSANTGKSGADSRILQALEQAKIKYQIIQ